jgi:hypothetical protein
MKVLLWAILALAAISVIFSTEIPLLRDTALYHSYRLKLITDRYLFVPHAFFGAIALLSGPPQFSARLRKKHLKFHRILGRVYVVSVLIAAPLAILLSTGGGVIVGTWVQAGSWIACTFLAFVTVRNRHIAVHRQWMIRSYAMTFSFVSLRVLDFWPWFVNLSDADETLAIVVATFLSWIVPDIAFNWREITSRRAPSHVPR